MRTFIEFVQDKGEEANWLLDEKDWIQKAFKSIKARGH